jgi:hypothetical protein
MNRPLTAFIDLNYRIDLPDDEIRSLLLNEPEHNENSTLLVYDQVQCFRSGRFRFRIAQIVLQLRTAIRHRRAFAGFTEHHIEFLP